MKEGIEAEVIQALAEVEESRADCAGPVDIFKIEMLSVTLGGLVLGIAGLMFMWTYTSTFGGVP